MEKMAAEGEILGAAKSLGIFSSERAPQFSDMVKRSESSTPKPGMRNLQSLPTGQKILCVGLGSCTKPASQVLLIVVLSRLAGRTEAEIQSCRGR